MNVQVTYDDTLYQLVPKEELLGIARRIESLKRECSMDPESPQAIRNGQYMSIALAVRSLLSAAPTPPAQPAERMPLTDKQKKKMWKGAHGAHNSWSSFDWYLHGVNDAEAAHGIKGES